MKIMIADDHPIYAEGLQNLLRAHDFTIVQVVHNGAEAEAEALRYRPDVILMDLHMPEMDGIEATRRIMAALPDTRIVILTAIDSDETLFDAIRAGAAGYLLKNLDGDALCRSLEAIEDGHNPFSPGLEDVLLGEIRRSTAKIEGKNPAGTAPLKRGSELTKRQHQILAKLSAGSTYKEIGQEFFISERTVKYHIERIKEKLGLKTQAQLVAFYLTSSR